MVRIFTALVFIFTFSFAKVYYAKVEPFEVRNISSSVSGLIISADENLVGTKLSSSAFVVIDSETDREELNYIKSKVISIEEIIKVNETVLLNLSETLSKKRENYKRVEGLKFKSTVEKDKEFYDLVSSENLYLSTKKEIENLKIQIKDMRLREVQLQRMLRDKKISAKGFTLYEMLVKPGQVVGISTPIAKVADISKAKLTLYLDEADVANAKQKVIYIDGVKTSYKISRVLSIADGKNISKYMAQIVIESPKLFSKLVKVEVEEK